jgi:hypothetical protein
MASVLTSIPRQGQALLIPHVYKLGHYQLVLLVVVFPKHLLVE